MWSLQLTNSKLFKNEIKTNKEIREVIDDVENSKKTMGQYIIDIKKTYDLSDGLLNELQNALKIRNFLVHKYFKIEIQKSYSDLGRKEMLKYFCDFMDTVNSIDSKLTLYYLKYKLRMGFTDEKIDELVQQMKNDELKREQANKI